MSGSLLLLRPFFVWLGLFLPQGANQVCLRRCLHFLLFFGFFSVGYPSRCKWHLGVCLLHNSG